MFRHIYKVLKKIVSFFAALFTRWYFRIILYIIGICFCFGIDHFINRWNIRFDEGTVLYEMLDFIKGKLSLSLFIGLIIGIFLTESKNHRARMKEESLKIESIQHRIVRKYSNHKKDNLTSPNNFYDKKGYMMQIHHIFQEDKIKNEIDDKYSKSYKDEQDMMDQYKVKRDGIHIPSLYIPTLNIFTNRELNARLDLTFSNEMFSLPQFVTENSSKILTAHSHSSISNNTTIRMNDVNYDEKINPDNNQNEKVLHFDLMKTEYYQMLVTNRCMDYKIDGVTLRELFEYKSEISPLNESVLGNQIGLNGVVITNDGYLLIEHRGLKKTTWRDKYGQPISYAVRYDKIKKYLNKGFVDKEQAEEAFLSTIRDSLKSNYGFVEGEDYEAITFSNNFMGFARDLLEGGKPNIYFYVTLKRIMMKLQKICSIM